MQNELLLIGSVFVIYGSVILAYKLFGKTGLFVMTALVTVLANIEVLIIVDAFKMEQTLGNVMFASSYLITDILSENEGQKDAAKAVWIGAFCSLAMIVFSQYWLLYIPAPSDFAAEHIRAIFSITPRLLLASFGAYLVSQRMDVWLYHLLWRTTEKRTGDKRSFLWLRNNCATLISQIVNTVLFTLIAFGGLYSGSTVISIMLSSYVIYVFTSLLDTPALYLARRLKEKGRIKS